MTHDNHFSKHAAVNDRRRGAVATNCDPSEMLVVMALEIAGTVMAAFEGSSYKKRQEGKVRRK